MTAYSDELADLVRRLQQRWSPIAGEAVDAIEQLQAKFAVVQRINEGLNATIEQLQADLAKAEADAADWESIARQIAIENLTGGDNYADRLHAEAVARRQP